MPDEEIVSRKDFLKKSVFKLFGFIQENFADNLGILGYSPLRPPGAIEEKDFLDTCVKCGKCATSCTQSSIKMSGLEAGFIAGYPVIIPAERPCFVCDDLSCMKACPTGALQLTDKLNIKMGIAQINQDKCITYKGKECNICVLSCPYPDEAIFINDDKHPVVNKSCIGCGLCDYWCDYNAITIKSFR